MDEKIIKANDKLATALIEDLRLNGCLSESNTKINNASRRLIQTYIDVYGSAWVGKFNLYQEDRLNNRPVLLEVKEVKEIRNFSCDFVIPHYDQEIVTMILDRDRAHGEDYRGTAWDLTLLEPIKERMTALDGFDLIWT